MDEPFRSTTHRVFREAMVARIFETQRALGFADMAPIAWHEWQIIANWEVAEHPNLKEELTRLNLRWERYL